MKKLTCEERDAILHADGRYEGWSVYSGFTDMTGSRGGGDPIMMTTWERDGRLIKDVRHPGIRFEGQPPAEDRLPCEHWDLGQVDECEQ